MKYIDINGKILRKDPTYYLRDLLEYPEYDGTSQMLQDYIKALDEDCEIHITNSGCLSPLLMETINEASEQNKYVEVYNDD